MASTVDRAEAASFAALGCAGVARLSTGPFGDVATLGPDARVPGVRVDTGTVEVHVVARYGVPLAELAEHVRVLVARADRVAATTVHVVIEDIEDFYD